MYSSHDHKFKVHGRHGYSEAHKSHKSNKHGRYVKTNAIGIDNGSGFSCPSSSEEEVEVSITQVDEQP